jgi:hypothetical protein
MPHFRSAQDLIATAPGCAQAFSCAWFTDEQQIPNGMARILCHDCLQDVAFIFTRWVPQPERDFDDRFLVREIVIDAEIVLAAYFLLCVICFLCPPGSRSELFHEAACVVIANTWPLDVKEMWTLICECSSEREYVVGFRHWQF